MDSHTPFDSAPLEVVVLAAGKGTRMRSSRPKVLHELAGRSLLGHVLATARQLEPAAIHVVVGHGAAAVRTAFSDSALNWVEQTEQLGTGHAVREALPAVGEDSMVLVLYGDVPLIESDTLNRCVAAGRKGLALITADMPDPAQLGRIVRNAAGDVERIVEFKDASSAERAICEINSGILAAPASLLREHLARLTTDNAQGELYLTDIIESSVQDSVQVTGLAAESPQEVAGINDRVQLAEMERVYQQCQALRLMRAGVTLRDPDRIDVRGTLSAGEDCVIDVNVVFEGDVSLGRNVRIGPGCVITDAIIGDDTELKPHTLVESAQIGQRCSLGPFARIRPGSRFADGVKIGNFVETKKTTMARNSKASHLAYLGDATIGAEVNIGAGTVTCNYDGTNKHPTHIGDDVFVGTNSTLVAPLILGDGAFVAAGSTVTKEAEAGDLVFGRARQSNRKGWTRPDKRDEPPAS